VWVFPDGLAGNELVTFQLALTMPNAIVLKHVCIAHSISISTNVAVDAVDLVDSQYSLACTMSLAASVRRLKIAWDTISDPLEYVKDMFAYTYVY